MSHAALLLHPCKVYAQGSAASRAARARHSVSRLHCGDSRCCWELAVVHGQGNAMIHTADPACWGRRAGCRDPVSHAALQVTLLANLSCHAYTRECCASCCGCCSRLPRMWWRVHPANLALPVWLPWMPAPRQWCPWPAALRLDATGARLCTSLWNDGCPYVSLSESCESCVLAAWQAAVQWGNV